MANDLTPLYDSVKRFEGQRLMPYYCPAGILTVGYGTTGAGVYPGIPWTKEQCETRMMRDIQRFVNGTLLLCPVLAQYDYRLCAIADFAYNCGLGNLRASTLRRRVNQEDWPAVKTEIMKWTRGGGRVLPGLVKRRIAGCLLIDKY